MHRTELTLATDLDGTFLGGTPSARTRLYQQLTRKQSECRLVFVTGRDLGFIEQIIAAGEVPRPDFIVGDIGTTVADGRTLSHYLPIEGHIAEAWQDASQRVAELLADAPGLTPQPGPFRYRLSYYYDNTFDPTILSAIDAVGLDWLMSAGIYLDILPKGVNKGTTLLKLLGHLGVASDSVVCAGDTLNDLALFETGLPGIVVGNAEPVLLEKTRSMPNTYHSIGHGSEGILEGLNYFGYGELVNHE